MDNGNTPGVEHSGKAETRPLFSGSRLMLSAGTLPTTGFTERVDAAGRAGFDAISLFPQQYLAARKREKLTPADMREILSSGGVTVDEVDPLLDWFGPAASPSEELMFEIAGELGASSINTPSAFAPDLELSEVAAALHRLGERAAVHGLQIALEFLPWTRVPDLRSALQVVTETGLANVGVMLDVWHFFRSGDSVETLRALTADQAARITSLQVNDAPATPRPLARRDKLALAGVMFGNLRDGIRINGAGRFFKVVSAAKATRPDATDLMNEASSGRLLPGSGDMPLATWLTALEAAGCRPAVGLEIFSLPLARLPAGEVASRAMSAWRDVSNKQ